MTKVTAISNVVYDGILYAPGEIIPVEDREAIEKLSSSGAAHVEQHKIPSPVETKPTKKSEQKESPAEAPKED